MVFDFPFSDLTLLLGDRKGVLPIKKFMLIFEWWWSDWSFARLGLPIYTTAISRACERSGKRSGAGKNRVSGSGAVSGQCFQETLERERRVEREAAQPRADVTNKNRLER